MYYEEYTKPALTEPGVKYFLNETLKQCHKFKEKYNNYIYNLGLCLGFFIILGIILLIKYKGKPTKEELYEKEQEKQKYILERIKTYQEQKLRQQQQLITGLPQWETEYDVLPKNIL